MRLTSPKCRPHLFFLSVFFVGMSTSSAYAYLDAGTGSMILQLLLGGVAGLAIAGKLYWYKFLSLFGIKSKTGDKDDRSASLARSEASTDK